MSGIGNKRVLLIGNGESEKELAFLKFRPAALVYSDLSSAAVKVLFERYDVSAYSGTLRGAAIDALALPCHDASVDFVYGFAMVHHLPDVALFLAEVYRVLAPGGQCVFFDDAYAPLWQGAKLTVLRPLMSYSHRTTGISPEDLRFTMSGGFRPDELGKIIRSLGGEPWFERTGFFTYIWSRAAEKLVPARVRRLFLAPMLGRFMAAIDRLLSPLLRANCIRLAWGFRKS
jgi:SAM-dependent methyltransferase